MPHVPHPERTPLISLGYEGLQKCDPRLLPSTLCGLCRSSFTDTRPPVLLKSGHRLHIDCYFKLFNPPKGGPQ
jgi:hypothetical protein